MNKLNRFLRNIKKKRENSLNFRRRRRKIDMGRYRSIGLAALVVLAVIFAAYLLIYAFFMQVTVLGQSMVHTIQNRDTVLVDRVSYRLTGPKRGDIIAFQPDGNRNAQYSVKRVIGLPGETIQIKDGAIYINGKVYTEDVTNESISEEGLASQKQKLGKDEYFVLGDNRNNSEDSRYETIGNVSKKEITGKVWFNVTLGNFGLME